MRKIFLIKNINQCITLCYILFYTKIHNTFHQIKMIVKTNNFGGCNDTFRLFYQTMEIWSYSRVR